MRNFLSRISSKTLYPNFEHHSYNDVNKQPEKNQHISTELHSDVCYFDSAFGFFCTVWVSVWMRARTGNIFRWFQA